AFISEECCRHKLSYHHKIYFSVTIEICEQRVRDHTRSDQLRTNLLCRHDKLATLDFHFTLGEHEEYIGIPDQLNILRVKLTSCPARTFGVGDQFHVFLGGVHASPPCATDPSVGMQTPVEVRHTRTTHGPVEARVNGNGIVHRYTNSVPICHRQALCIHPVRVRQVLR